MSKKKQLPDFLTKGDTKDKKKAAVAHAKRRLSKGTKPKPY